MRNREHNSVKKGDYFITRRRSWPWKRWHAPPSARWTLFCFGTSYHILSSLKGQDIRSTTNDRSLTWMCRRGISSASSTPPCEPWCVQPALLGKEKSQRSSPRCGICIPPAQRPIGSSRSCKRQKGPCDTAPFRLVFKLGILIASYRKLLFKIKAAALSNSGLLLIVPSKTNQGVRLGTRTSY